MERRSVAQVPTISESIFSTGPSAMDPSRETPLTIMSFASEWHFKPEGVNLVKKRFEMELARLENIQQWEFQVEIRLDYDRVLWQVKCAKADYNRIWKTFFIVWNGVIRQAVNSANQRRSSDDQTAIVDPDDDEDYDFDRDEPLDSNLVERLAVWKKQNALNPVAEIESGNHLAEVNTLTAPVTQDEFFPAEIQFCKYRQAWSCGDKSIMLDELLTEIDLNELIRLTSCKFSMNLNNGIMFVGAHEEENLLLAVQKLRNIERNWQYRHPWVNHLFYNEETANTKYVLKFYVDVNMAYFETTLLDNLHVAFSNGACDYESLTNAVTIRCAPYVPVRSEYVPIKRLNISAIKIEDVPGGVKVFLTTSIYNSKGDPSENPMRHLPADVAGCDPAHTAESNVQQLERPLELHMRSGPKATDKDESVQKWATGVPDAIGSGDARAPIILPDGTVASGHDTRKKADWDRYEEYSPEKSAKIVEGELYWNEKNTRSGAFGLISRPSASNVYIIPGPRFQGPAFKGISYTPSLGMPRSVSMPQVTTSSDGLMEPLKPIILHSQSLQAPPIQSQPRQNHPLVHHQAARGHYRSASLTASVAPPKRSTPRRPFLELVARSNNVPSSLLDEEDPISESLQIGILEPILGSLGCRDQGEKEQPVFEADTRIFHQTMKQLAPKPKFNAFVDRISTQKPGVSSVSNNGLMGPLPEFAEGINQSFKELVAGLRGYRGKAVVQAEFGRIILGRFHPKQLSMKGKDHLLDGAFLQNLLLNPTDYGPTVDFTSVLTTVSAEIQYMVNMKGKGGQNLWEMNKVSSWNTTYEFVFTDPQNPLYPFMVEVDAETFVAQIKARCRLGNLFIYGTKRHWDVKVAAIGYGIPRALESKYGDIATAIQSSLFIPPGSSQPYLSWKLDASMEEKFVMQEVTVRRVYEYKSTDQKSILRVSELQSLDIDGGPTGDDSFWIYEAKLGDLDRTPNEKLTRWYEASVTSVQLDAVLKQNESLDLGDETAWTLDDVANMEASKALYSPALEMLSQMDGVGQNSHNGSDYRSRQTDEHRMQAQATHNPVVWW